MTPHYCPLLSERLDDSFRRLHLVRNPRDLTGKQSGQICDSLSISLYLSLYLSPHEPGPAHSFFLSEGSFSAAVARSGVRLTVGSCKTPRDMIVTVTT